jgi:hypothetical protein
VTPAAIAGGVSSLLDDPARAAALGDAAYVRVAERFDDRVSIPLIAKTIATLAGIGVP